VTKINCPDDFLLFLYKQLLLAWEMRSGSVKYPRQPEAGRLLASAGITVITAKDKLAMEQRLSESSGRANTLILDTGKKAMMDQLFRHLRNAVAHAHYRCNRRAGGSVEIFHEYGGTKRLFGTVKQQALQQLINLSGTS
jgi:hypothetical protein